MKYRHEIAPELFMGAYIDDVLIAHIMATRSLHAQMTKESFYSHDTAGPTVCIHSICVDSQHRGRGIASFFISKYLLHLRALEPKVAKVVLLCHKQLLNFYMRNGFKYHGLSAIQHGIFFY